MRVALKITVSGAILLCGCAGNRAYRPTGPTLMPGGATPGGAAVDSGSDLGTPTPVLPHDSSPESSSYKPKKSSAPKLGPLLPTAGRERTIDNPLQTAQLHAPDPVAAAPKKSSEVDARPISGFEKPVIVENQTWSSYYRSTEKRAIESMILGSGARHVVILASLHGDETQSQALIDELSRCLKAQPEYLKQNTVLLIKTPNPDGTSDGSPYNSRGIDLNRNFPSDNWVALDNKRGGPKAGSEIETKALVRLLGEFKPSLLVHVKDSRSQGYVNYEGAARNRAEQIASLMSCQVMQGRGARTSGSVENYAQTRLSCPSLTLLLPREESDDEAWSTYGAALLSLLESVAPAGSSGNASRRPARGSANGIEEQPDPFDDNAIRNSSSKSKAPVRKTSKSDDRSRLPEFPSPVPEQGYLELPPP
ncbi:MAG: succinylglutamate desuccinylase/aspartoacylase family protein [Planctomycetes bacterium]|nr:succinylglutamate desuccinylase/aspartoacylase family protein [Planctomycetota bacterium]